MPRAGARAIIENAAAAPAWLTPNVALTLASGLGMLLGLQRFRRGRRRG